MSPKKEKKDLEAEVWNAITAFEQILEAMPNDRASLEALSHAYEQIGDLTKAKEFFVRLGTVLVDEGDIAAASALLDRLKGMGPEDEEVTSLIGRIESAGGGALTELAGPAPADPAGHATPVTQDAPHKAKKKVNVSTAFNMSEELAMAWNLMEAHKITQEEYASVVQDLTEMSAGDSVATISALHVLEARGFKNLEKIITFLVQECQTPFVSLSNFDMTLDAALLLPLDFVVRRGAIVYDILGHDALAVVMNPFDKQLRNDVEALADRKCHFYLTLPSDFDRSAEKAEELVVEAEAEAAEDQ